MDADTFVLALPMTQHQPALALLAFIGGLSAATGMVIVETVALSTMICNDLVMPMLLRFAWLRLAERRDLSGLLLGIRRGAIVFHPADRLSLLSAHRRILRPCLDRPGFLRRRGAVCAGSDLGGLYWKGGVPARRAWPASPPASLLWTYTLLLPSFARSGWLPESFVEHGPLGIALLKPYALFGLSDLSSIAHSLFWSLPANVGAFVGVSLFDRQSAIERIQATLFVEVFEHGAASAAAGLLHGTVWWRSCGRWPSGSLAVSAPTSCSASTPASAASI